MAVVTRASKGSVLTHSEMDTNFEEINLKAPLASPVLTGTPTAPTASTGTNTTQLATTEFVTNRFKGKEICTAWVNFDGTTTPPTIRDSYNVSSVVRIDTGVYDVYFTTSMDNVNYSVAGISSTEGHSGKVTFYPKNNLTNKFSIANDIASNITCESPSILTLQILGGKNV
jgi:hypothetical protein